MDITVLVTVEGTFPSVKATVSSVLVHTLQVGAVCDVEMSKSAVRIQSRALNWKNSSA